MKNMISSSSLNKVMYAMIGISILYFINVIICMLTHSFFVTRGILFLVYVVACFTYLATLAKDFSVVNKKDLMIFNGFFLLIMVVDFLLNGLLGKMWSLSIYSFYTSPILISITFVAMMNKLRKL